MRAEKEFVSIIVRYLIELRADKEFVSVIVKYLIELLDIRSLLG